jgi:hypothetical protein
LGPRDTTLYSVTNPVYRVSALVGSVNGTAGCNVDSVVFFRDTYRLGQATQDNILPDKYNFDYNVPTTEGSEYLRACVYVSLAPNPTVFNCSNSVRVSTQWPLAVEDALSEKLEFEVYPNPASDIVTVAWKGLSQTQTTITLSEITGKTLITNRVTNFESLGHSTLDVTELQKGVYFVTVKSQGSTQTKRFVKN